MRCLALVWGLLISEQVSDKKLIRNWGLVAFIACSPNNVENVSQLKGVILLEQGGESIAFAIISPVRL